IAVAELAAGKRRRETHRRRREDLERDFDVRRGAEEERRLPLRERRDLGDVDGEELLQEELAATDVSRELRDVRLHAEDERSGEVVLVVHAEVLQACAREVVREEARLDELASLALGDAIEDRAQANAHAADVRLRDIDRCGAVLFEERATLDED